MLICNIYMYVIFSTTLLILPVVFFLSFFSYCTRKLSDVSHFFVTDNFDVMKDVSFPKTVEPAVIIHCITTC